MEENKKFGEKLRELRTKAGMSLRELADKVNVDFTYLSKIENGVLPPPSEKVIRLLAESLKADEDELLTLAGKIPPDIAEILKDRETLEQLRSERAKKEEKAAAASRKNMSLPTLSIPFKNAYRLAIPIFLVIVVATSLWFASPTQALTIDITNPSSGTLGSTHTFSVTVNIQDLDLIPITGINLYIFKNGSYTNTNSPYKATLADLPLSSTSKSYTSAQTGGGAATVTASTSTGWGYAYQAGTGYAIWEGTGYSFIPATGYGYGYGGGATYITYNISWTSPSSWPVGNYKIETKITAANHSFTKTGSAFTLSAAAAGGGGGGGGGGGAIVEITVEELEAMTTEEAAEQVEELTTKEAAELIEEVTTDTAADIIEEVTTDTAADIIKRVTTDKAASIIEKVTTDKAVGIIEKLTIDKAADIIEKLTTDKAVDIIEKLTIDKAADIIEKLTTDKAASTIEKLTTQKAAPVLEKLSTAKAAAAMEQLSLEKLNTTITAMSETSLTERLPALSVEKLYSIEAKILFDSLPNTPTEQLISETPPQPSAELGAPVTVYDTPSGAKYLAIQTLAGEWVVVVGTPEPIDQIMIKTNKALKDVGTTLEISEQQPPEVLIMLPIEQTARAYFTISFENATPDDIELGHMTFKVEKEWLEQNSVHKWSVIVHRYDPELNKWTALPTKRVKEDNTYVYYSVVVNRFSTFVISGSQTVPTLPFQVTNLEISPTEAKIGEAITISADITNTSHSPDTYATTLWLNGTVEAGKDVYIKDGQTESVSFTVTPATDGSYEVRIDRLLGSFSLGKLAPEPVPEPIPTAPKPTPEPAPSAPEPTPVPVAPVTPVTPINWWLIGGIVAAVAIIAVAVWLMVTRRRSHSGTSSS
jgi:PGF-pre-PGF domain-containing protein